jgi:hypothetical protein
MAQALLALALLAAGGIDYREYDRLTRLYVSPSGRVDYAGLKNELPALRGFIDQLGATSPDNRPELFPDDWEKLRYYMTAYNAWVLYVAASEYPSKTSLWRFGLFRNRDIKLGGRDTTLEYLEHEVIRKRFHDPRIHFYINCAAVSCPRLEQGAIPAGKTDAALDRAARRFVNDTTNVRYDAAGRRLYLSKIFDWFAEDFLAFLKTRRGIAQPHIAQYILIYLEGPAREALAKTSPDAVTVAYFPYDKSLNEIR